MATWFQSETKRAAGASRRGTPLETTPADFLATIPPSDRDPFLSRSARHQVRRGEVVFLEGADVRHLYLVLGGSFKLVRQSPDGKELIVGLVASSELFGAIEGPVESSVLARALEDSELLAVPVGVLRNVLAGNADLASDLLRRSEQRRKAAEALAARLAFDGVPRRLSLLLLDISEPRSGFLRFPLSQSEIAQAIGSSRETVCSLLNQFRRSGLVEISRGRIRVVDRGGLETVG